MSRHDVVIAGGGPTGMVLAAELVLAGVDVAVVERRRTPEREGARAGGLHARTLELLDQRGVVERFLAEGKAMQVAGFAMLPLGIGDFPTRHPYGLALFQAGIERVLGQWAAELGVRVLRGAEVTGHAQDDAGVDVRLDGGRTLRAGWLVGCDGGRSRVRKDAGIAFTGHDASVSTIIAEGEVGEAPELGVRRDTRGIHGIAELGDGRVRIVVSEDAVHTGEPAVADLRAAMTSVWGTDFGLRGTPWASRFTDAARQAEAYRSGRVLLAGDACHVHSPAGGQGLNTGVHDAVNLGWKLAQVVHGTSPDALLDTYHAERHPVGAAVLRTTMAMTALHRNDPRTEALRDVMAELLQMDEPRRRLAARVSGLDVRYDLGDGHPLLGRRMPDLDLGDGRRVAGLLHAGRPLLLDLGTPGGLPAAAPWATRLRHEVTSCTGPWELPALGEVTAPAAVLVRPDGHVAWTGDGTDAGLADALTAWCGPV